MSAGRAPHVCSCQGLYCQSKAKDTSCYSKSAFRHVSSDFTARSPPRQFRRCNYKQLALLPRLAIFKSYLSQRVARSCFNSWTNFTPQAPNSQPFNFRRTSPVTGGLRVQVAKHGIRQVGRAQCSGGCTRTRSKSELCVARNYGRKLYRSFGALTHISTLSTDNCTRDRVVCEDECHQGHGPVRSDAKCPLQPSGSLPPRRAHDAMVPWHL